MFVRLLFALSLLSSFTLAAQFGSPVVTWSFSSEHVEDDQFDIVATATIEDGWMTYSQFTGDAGPVPTAFIFDEGEHFALVGKPRENGNVKSGYDKIWEADITKLKSGKPANFIQRIRVTNYATPVTGLVEYMACNDEQCLPPDEEPFSFNFEPRGEGRGAVEPPVEPATRTSTTADKPAVDGVRTEESIPIKGTADGNRVTISPGTAPDVTTAPAPTPEKAPIETENTDTEDTFVRGQTYSLTGPAATQNTPMQWSLAVTKLGANAYELAMTGELAGDWTIYSRTVDPDAGPSPTDLYVDFSAGVEALGPVREESPHLYTGYDKVWEAEITKIKEGKVTYTQAVQVDGATEITGLAEYQACDDEQCIPPIEVPFSVELSGDVPALMVDGVTAGSPAARDTPNADALATAQLGITTDFNTAPAAFCSEGAVEVAGKSGWELFGLGVLGGLFALLMPCIFPMIPLTVSFFTKSGGSRAEGVRRAGLYGFFIFMIYVLLSAPFHLIDGLEPGILNDIASNVWLNLAFFLTFIFFAGSFFGFYELTLPSSWSNRATQAEGAGGIMGIFFMALTLAIVSFSCTGPLLGSLLVKGVSDGAWPLTAGMAGFGVALGLPFALFAAFPGVLNNLPKSGGWLNSVKVVLGFAEIALAFKFLSNADLVGDWDLLRIEPFLAVWILCALGIAAYLFKLISFPLDSKKRSVGLFGGLVGAASLAFAGYLALGLTVDSDTGTYRVRKIMSGLAPPVCYNYLAPCDKELNITPFKTLAEGLEYAKQVDKPVMIDFTGFTCVNCRKMEENVWVEPQIKRYLQEEYVIVSLYTDDRAQLPQEEVREVTRLDGTGRKKRIDQVGEKWHYFQQQVFARSSQPYYVLVTPDGQTLNPPVAYTPDVNDYEEFLACGLKTYRGMMK